MIKRILILIITLLLVGCNVSSTSFRSTSQKLLSTNPPINYSHNFEIALQDYWTDYGSKQELVDSFIIYNGYFSLTSRYVGFNYEPFVEFLERINQINGNNRTKQNEYLNYVEDVWSNQLIAMRFTLQYNLYYDKSNITNSIEVFNWFKNLIMYSKKLQENGNKVVVFFNPGTPKQVGNAYQEHNEFMNKYMELIEYALDSADLTMLAIPERYSSLYDLSDYALMQRNNGKEVYTFKYKDCSIKEVCYEPYSFDDSVDKYLEFLMR